MTDSFVLERASADTFDRESRALLSAARAVARLDERLRAAPSRHILPWFLRTESLAVTAAEGRASDEIRLCSLIEGGQPRFIMQSDRTALDIRDALRSLLDTRDEGDLHPDLLAAAWKTSDRSNQRRRDEAFEYRTETDAGEASAMLSSLLATPDPWTAADAFRRLWTSKWFHGHGRRMALALAPLLVRRGFGSPRALVGLSRSVSLSPEKTREAAGDPEAWPTFFFEAVAAGAARTYEAASALANARETFLRACPPQRSSASNEAAIDAMLENPVASIARIASDLRLTPTGANKVLSKLASAGVIATDDPRAKNRLYVCRKAIGL